MVVQILTSDLWSYIFHFHPFVKHSWETLGTGTVVVNKQRERVCPCAVCI